MNLDLLESFGQNYPEEFDGTLDCISLAITCTFNRYGTLLAVGCNDGRIVLWDFLTRGIAKIITAHIHPVCSLSFTRDGRKLVSASTDNTVCVWQVLTGDCLQKYTFPSPVLKVQFHPRNERLFLVCPLKYAAVLVDCSTREHRLVPLDDDTDLNIVASFDRQGEHIFTGNAKGKVVVVRVSDLEVVVSFRVTTGSQSATAIKSIEFSRRGDHFLCNTADRVIRVYDSRKVVERAGEDVDVEPTQKLQDLVNKTTWKKCCFSGDGEFICAGSARQHALYVWERSVGNLVKILHGTKGETLFDVVWHPVRPIIASISSGVVSIWAQAQVENWSAFAPDFKELDENVEYEERESEFDLEDEDKSVQMEEESRDEEVEVDVETEEPVAAYCSSDEDGEAIKKALLYLPIAPDIDEPEEGWGGDGPGIPSTGILSDSGGGSGRNVHAYDVQLKDAPVGEPHPLVGNGKKNQVTAGKPKQPGQPASAASQSAKPPLKDRTKDKRFKRLKVHEDSSWDAEHVSNSPS
ncbi:retinoblastoma-binding protein 5 homolog [Varroa destructor]|uniref:Uncharacterized protein n=1 Tax=Varroa destructor TaxID=109461 RepID=A0A7M7KKT3_VARDE|nr:retinoblastoma-binding protein 5 homolog [Varroa destructor]